MGKIAEALLADEGDVLERSCRASVQADSDLLWGPSKGQRTRDAYEAAPRFVLLNFRCSTCSALPKRSRLGHEPACTWLHHEGWVCFVADADRCAPCWL